MTLTVNRMQVQRGDTRPDLPADEVGFLDRYAGVPDAGHVTLADLAAHCAARSEAERADSLTLEQAAARTGRSIEALRADIDSGGLLAFPGSPGRPAAELVIPAWQFDTDWRPLPHLPAVLAALGGVSAETARSVMTTPTTDLGDTRVVPEPVTPAAWLAEGNDPAPVLAFVETLGEQI